MTVQLTIILAPLHYRVSIPYIDVLHYIFSKFYGLEYLEMVRTYCAKKIVLVIEKNFWNSRLKYENLQTFWDHQNNLFKQ